MTEFVRPTTDDIVALNDDLNVIYSRWANGTVFRRVRPIWEKMRLHYYVPPTSNQTLVGLLSQGVEWVLAEHVSVTVQGTVYYSYDTATGVVEDVGLPGHHNVENGGGYLPVRGFTRRCEDDHISCCIYSRPDRQKGGLYSFEIAETADPGAAFSHEVLGLSGTFIVGKKHD